MQVSKYQFDTCCLHFYGTKKSPEILISSHISEPVACGILRPFILLPPLCRDRKYVLLHELVHCRRRDTLIHIALQVFTAFNWFNPAVHLAARRMKQDRELCCDSVVLEVLSPHEHISYGYAILNWSSAGSIFTVGIGSTKKALYKRICSIASYHPVSASQRRLSFFILVVFLAATCLLTPEIQAHSEYYNASFSQQSVHREDLSRQFGDLEGSFVLYDENRKQYTIYSEETARTRISPVSTYKIYSALFSLEEGIITPENSLQSWDGSKQPFPEWEHTQTLDTAMGQSVNWYFQDLDKKIGRKKLQFYYNRLHYGNCDLSSGLSQYWKSSLKISPLEQVILLTGLCENRWDFHPSSLESVKSSMEISPGFYGKTGTGMEHGHETNGWFIGYIESDANRYIFALNLQGPDGASGTKAFQLTCRILKEKNLLQP